MESYPGYGDAVHLAIWSRICSSSCMDLSKLENNLPGTKKSLKRHLRKFDTGCFCPLHFGPSFDLFFAWVSKMVDCQGKDKQCKVVLWTTIARHLQSLFLLQSYSCVWRKKKQQKYFWRRNKSPAAQDVNTKVKQVTILISSLYSTIS